MTRSSLWRATRPALLIGLPVMTSCSAPANSLPAQPDDGLTIIEPPTGAWPTPCSVPEGTTFAANLDRSLGSSSSTAGQIFAAHVSRTVSACDRDVIAKGAIVRGRVVDVERGDRPRLALELLDVDTFHGRMQVPMLIRSAAGYTLGKEERPYRAFVLYGPQGPPESGPEPSVPTSPGLEVQIPRGSELVIELSKPIIILP